MIPNHKQNIYSFQSQFENIILSKFDQNEKLQSIKRLVSNNITQIYEIFLNFIIQLDQIQDYLSIFECIIGYFTPEMLRDLQLLNLTTQQYKVDAICLHSLLIIINNPQLTPQIKSLLNQQLPQQSEFWFLYSTNDIVLFNQPNNNQQYQLRQQKIRCIINLIENYDILPNIQNLHIIMTNWYYYSENEISRQIADQLGKMMTQNRSIEENIFIESFKVISSFNQKNIIKPHQKISYLMHKIQDLQFLVRISFENFSDQEMIEIFTNLIRIEFSFVITRIFLKVTDKMVQYQRDYVLQNVAQKLIPLIIPLITQLPYNVLKILEKYIDVSNENQSKDLILKCKQNFYDLHQNPNHEHQISKILNNFFFKNQKYLNDPQLNNLKTLMQTIENRLVNQRGQSQTQKFYKGLKNLGNSNTFILNNSCFINCFLQALYLSTDFSQKYIRTIYQFEKNPKLFATGFQLQRIFAQLELSNSPYINIQNFYQPLPEYFRNFQQHDTNEFGKFLFDNLEQFFKLTKHPNLLDIFTGKQKNSFKCLNCSNITSKEELFQDLQINIIQNANIEQLIIAMFQDEKLENDQQYNCDFCNRKTDAIISKQIIQFPEYIILTLNRFYFDKLKLQKNKILDQIILPQVFDIFGQKYKIYAIIFHKGTGTDNGHYFTMGKDYERNQDKIIIFNDICVTFLNEFTKQNLQDPKYFQILIFQNII